MFIRTLSKIEFEFEAPIFFYENARIFEIQFVLKFSYKSKSKKLIK